MGAPRLEALPDQRVVSFQVNKAHLGILIAQAIAIRLLERRAGNDCGLPVAQEAFNQLPQRRQPGGAVCISQGNPAPHLLDIRLRMKIVSVVECPTRLTSQERSDRGLARAGNAHEDQQQWFLHNSASTALAALGQPVVRGTAKEEYLWR